MTLRKRFAILLVALLISAAPICHAIDRADYDMPYYIVVDIANQIVTVYDSATDGVVRQMLCSSGRNITPLGTFVMPRGRTDRDRKPWYYIAIYDRFVKYASRIYDMILFHSIPYRRQSLQSIDAKAASELGEPTSHGCIRLRWQAAAFISQNCLPGTVVMIVKGDKRDDALRELLRQQSYDAASGQSYDSFLGISREPGALARFSEGPEVLNLQYRLRDLGLYDGELSGVYDSATVNAVRKAQYIRGDELNGVATADYQALLYGPDAPVAMEVRLTEGMSGPAVKALQNNLAALGLYRDTQDSVFDADVVRAVTQFQRAYGYEEDGVASPTLQKAVAYEAGRLAETFGGADYTCELVGEPLTMARVNVKEGARLREDAAQESRQLRRLAEGRTMIVLERGETWSRVRVNGEEGYVRNDLVVFYDRLLVLLKYTSATEDLVWTIGNGVDDYLSEAELPCEVFETYLAANDQQVDVESLENYVTVDTGAAGPPLNLRQAPEPDSAVLDTVENGKRLPALRRTSEWTQVNFHGKTGYLMNRYLKFWTGPKDALDEELDADASEAQAIGHALVRSVAGRKAPVYDENIDGAEVLGHLPNDTRVEVLSAADGWCWIRYEGRDGYMSVEDLRLEDEGDDGEADDSELKSETLVP